MPKRTKITLEIREDVIKLCEVGMKKGQLIVYQMKEIQTPEGSVEDGEIKDFNELRKIIYPTLKRMNYKNKKTLCVLHSSKIAQKEVVLPYLKKKLFEEMLEENMQDYFPMPIENYSVRYTVLEQMSIENKKEVRVLLMAAPISLLSAYPLLCKKLGLKFIGTDYSGNSSLQLVKKYLDNSINIVLQFEKESTQIMINEGEVLLFQRSIPYGSSSLIQEDARPDFHSLEREEYIPLQQQEQVSYEMMEEVATTAVLESAHMPETAEYLLNNIQRVIDYYQSKYPLKPIQRGYLFGVQKIDQIEQMLTEQLRISFSRLKIKSKIQVPKRADEELIEGFATNIGAILAPINFKIFDEKTERKKKRVAYRQNFLFVMGILGSGLLVGVPYFQLNQLEIEKDRLETQIKEVQDIYEIEMAYSLAHEHLREMESFYEITKDPTENTLQMIRLLEQMMPQEVSFTDLNVSNGIAVLSGEATTKTVVARLLNDLYDNPHIKEASIGTLLQREIQEGEESAKEHVTFTLTFQFEMEEGGEGK
jgi:type IV pilus assembly protein PilM